METGTNLEKFIHDPLLTWRLTNAGAASPVGPNFRSERDMALGAPNGGRPRRLSVLDGDIAPSELLANGEPPAPPMSRPRARTNSTAAANGTDNGQDADNQNAKAVELLERVAQKLTGRDFKKDEELDVINQVNKLIIEATKLENLCQHYIGWCSFW